MTYLYIIPNKWHTHTHTHISSNTKCTVNPWIYTVKRKILRMSRTMFMIGITLSRKSHNSLLNISITFDYWIVFYCYTCTITCVRDTTYITLIMWFTLRELSYPSRPYCSLIVNATLYPGVSTTFSPLR